VGFDPLNGTLSVNLPKGTSVGDDGSNNIVFVSISIIVPEKLRGILWCYEEKDEKEKRTTSLVAFLASL